MERTEYIKGVFLNIFHDFKAHPFLARSYFEMITQEASKSDGTSQTNSRHSLTLFWWAPPDRHTHIVYHPIRRPVGFHPAAIHQYPRQSPHTHTLTFKYSWMLECFMCSNVSIIITAAGSALINTLGSIRSCKRPAAAIVCVCVSLQWEKMKAFMNDEADQKETGQFDV